MRIGVLCAVLIVPLAVGAGAASANVIVQHPVSELINEPTYVETAANGDLFVGTVREIIDASGADGHPLDTPLSVAAYGRVVYVVGTFSGDVFQISPLFAPALSPVALGVLALGVLAVGCWATRAWSAQYR